ncbi:MAG TPA: hypothetical protein VM368_08315, partial [Flavisolibacter sp.]|nr:hypothetical protein [Flavisolibacter sp.]
TLTNNMRKIFSTALAFFLATSLFAQTDTAGRVLRPARVPSSDHFMIQLGSAIWLNKPDSIRTAGLPRTVNIYVMLAFPFKTNPNMSVAIGPGISNDNMFFNRTNIGIKENTPAIRFQNAADTNAFKKYKLSTVFAEAPIELRYSSNPGDNAKSIKAAVGVKVGTLLSAWVKGKELQNRSGNAIGDYTMKEKSKKFFNTTRLSLTGRVGYGHFSLFASYAVTPLFKEGLGPKIQPMAVGLAISGL